VAEKFEVGEVAIYVRPGSKSYGQEVTILSPLRLRRLWNREGTSFRLVEAHEVKFGEQTIGVNGHPFGAVPEELRKKPPKVTPREQVGEWELCPWQPDRQTVCSSQEGP